MSLLTVMGKSIAILLQDSSRHIYKRSRSAKNRTTIIVRFSIIFLTGQIAKKPDCPVKNRTPGNPNQHNLTIIYIRFRSWFSLSL